MSGSIFVPVISSGLIITLGFDLYAQEPATAVITPTGEIFYYSTSDRGAQGSEPGWKTLSREDALENIDEFKTAVEDNTGIKDFLTSNPDLYIAAGRGNVIFSMYAADPLTGSAQSISLASKGTEPVKGEPSRLLDTDKFLSNLANNLTNQTRRMACGMSLTPTTVEATASVGVVSFTANWDIEDLCAK